VRKHSSLPIGRCISGGIKKGYLCRDRIRGNCSNDTSKFGTLVDACETSEKGGKLLGECESRKRKSLSRLLEAGCRLSYKV
jgi:hypothetical protein